MNRCFEDFPVGMRLRSARYQVTPRAIEEFAREYDPQPFHLDQAAAEKTLFGGLAASGWHTAAISMRLFIETMQVPGGIIGLAVDELRWPTAVRPGDDLHVDTEILAARLSGSRPGQGILRIQNVTRNQRDQIVQSFTATAMLPTRG
ncbi:MAG: MaoC family dehydratase [Verrucomicrobiota bacterium]